MGASVRDAFDFACAAVPKVCSGLPHTLAVYRTFVDVYTLLVCHLVLPADAPRPSRGALLSLAAEVGRATGDAAFARACAYDEEGDREWTTRHARVLVDPSRRVEEGTAAYTACVVAIAAGDDAAGMAAKVHDVHVRAAFRMSDEHRRELRVARWADVQCAQSTLVDHAVVRGLVSRASRRKPGGVRVAR